jgi:hypothetical protein
MSCCRVLILHCKLISVVVYIRYMHVELNIKDNPLEVLTEKKNTHQIINFFKRKMQSKTKSGLNSCLSDSLNMINR